MHRNVVNLNHKLAEALTLLEIGEIRLRNDNGEEVNIISPREHAKALFTYFNMAGYLHESLLEKAVDYLDASKAFTCEKVTVLNDLKKLCVSSNPKGQFDAEFFISNFASQPYFSVVDVIDLITFLQQTAFDRQYGVERDRLQVKPWLEEHSVEFKEIAIKLGVVTPLPPIKNQYFAAGIMGATCGKVRKRLEYFCNLTIECNLVWALSGNRELSKGLDAESEMEKIAAYLMKPLNYIQRKVGVDTREFLEGITETMMVNCLIQEICPNKQIGILDSNIESGHWRATTAQSAADIVPIILNKIQTQEIKNVKDGQYQFFIIAEQPYAGRMAKQVQREFNKEIKKNDLQGKIFIKVEGCGPGIAEQKLFDNQVLTRLNSELGALMAERFNDARNILQQTSGMILRDPNIIMFSKRDDAYQACIEARASTYSKRAII